MSDVNLRPMPSPLPVLTPAERSRLEAAGLITMRSDDDKKPARVRPPRGKINRRWAFIPKHIAKKAQTMRDNGAGVHEIASKLGMSIGSVQRHTKNNTPGHRGGHQANPRFSWEWAEAKLRQGWKLRDVAKAMGVSLSLVSGHTTNRRPPGVPARVGDIMEDADLTARALNGQLAEKFWEGMKLND